MSTGSIIAILLLVVTIIAIVIAVAKAYRDKDNDSYEYDSESKDNLRDFVDNIQTDKEDSEKSDEEKYQQALNTIKHPAGIMPGLGNQNPIDAPNETVELDSKEIPWELKNNDDE